MRSTTMPVVFLLVALIGGCDTTDPIQVETSILDLSVISTGAQVATFNVWGMTEVGASGQWLWCEETIVGPSQRPAAPNSIPWFFTTRISVLRNGETVWENLTSDEALSGQNNMSAWDSSPPVTGETPSKSPLTVDDSGTPRTFEFTTWGKVSSVHEEVVTQTSNPVSDLYPLMYGYGNGLCSPGYPGPAVLDGEELPYVIELNKGDTVKVEARVLGEGPTGFGLENQQTSLASELFRDGVSIAVNGTTQTSPQYGAGFSFSYTSR